LDIDTCGSESEAFFRLKMFRMTLIVAMSMEQHFVTQVVVVVIPVNMVHFHEVSILKVQFTPATFALLFLKESRFRLMHHWVRFQALAPVKQVSIIRTRASLHFGVPLNGRFAVHPQFCACGCCKYPCALFHLMPISLCHPLGSFVGMSGPYPRGKLFPQHIITSAKDR